MDDKASHRRISKFPFLVFGLLGAYSFFKPFLALSVKHDSDVEIVEGRRRLFSGKLHSTKSEKIDEILVTLSKDSSRTSKGGKDFILKQHEEPTLSSRNRHYHPRDESSRQPPMSLEDTSHQREEPTLPSRNRHYHPRDESSRQPPMSLEDT
jgi:hypothetical protein